MSSPAVSIVIPVGPGGTPDRTIESIESQTYRDFEFHVVYDGAGRGAPWARNEGARAANGEYLLFSDADVEWVPDALETMVTTLEAAAKIESAVLLSGTSLEWVTGYAYGGKRITGNPGGDIIVAMQPWSFESLKRQNFVDTGSLIVREAFTGWDESLRRLQDWDLWLGMAMRFKIRGQWCKRVLFSTTYREDGISSEMNMRYEDAWRIVRRKYGLLA